MRIWAHILALLTAGSPFVAGQSSELQFPQRVVAGTVFSVPTSGSGEATLYIVGPSRVLQRKVRLGESIAFSAEDLHLAGPYVAVLTSGSSSRVAQFNVVASPAPAKLSFLAKPSRLPVNLSNAVSGVVYVFDRFGNLILEPQQLSFELTDSTGRKQSHAAASHNGVGWVRMNSGAKAGTATFAARAADVHETRVIQQVPGEPCTIRMAAHPGRGQRVVLETQPVLDCSGNPVPDGTIVSFSESFAGTQSTVDVPLKRGIAKTELPSHPGAVISVASGVVMGNEIRWNGGL